jgi:transposase
MSSKAELCTVIKGEVIVVGIDVAKRSHVAAIRIPDGRVKKPFSFSNDRVGFNKLLTRVEVERKRYGCSSLLFALESSGHYGHALKYYLVDRGLSVVGVNPAHTKRIKELEDNSPEKSDSKDARIIADLAAQGRGRRLVIPQGVYADLRRLGKLREQLIRERTRLLNRYKGLVDLVFPELDRLVSNVAYPSIRYLMAEYPSAVDVARMRFSTLYRRLRRWSIGHLSEERCRRIHAAAKGSVGVREGLGAARLEMRQTLKALERVGGCIAEVEEAQEDALRHVSYAERLLSIPELGPVTVATILGETGDLRQYRKADAVIKLAGLNLYTISSGSFRGKTRITKRGRPLLRRYLYLAALRLSKKGSPFIDFHDRLVPTKAKPQIAIAICRKLVRVMVALVRDDATYKRDRPVVEMRTSAVA